MQWNSDRDGGARPKNGAFVCLKYGLLAPEGSAGDIAAAGPLGSGYEPKETTGTRDTKGIETGPGEWNR